MATIAMTTFAQRQWRDQFPGTKIIGITAEELTAKATEFASSLLGQYDLAKGQTDSVIHLFLENETATRCEYAPISTENKNLLNSEYIQPTFRHIPLLERWFEGCEAPVAKYLDVVLYSRSRMEEMYSETSLAHPDIPNADWSIVSISGELYRKTHPKNPEKLLHNHLNNDLGGNGEPLDITEYTEAVSFWNDHAMIK